MAYTRCRCLYLFLLPLIVDTKTVSELAFSLLESFDKSYVQLVNTESAKAISFPELAFSTHTQRRLMY